MTNNQMKKKIERSMKQIAKQRDVLREIEVDAKEVADLCDQALDDLGAAVDTLSEMV